MDIHGKVVLITGGGRGIGASMAKAFSEAGAKVAIVSRSKEEVDSVVNETHCIGIIGDVREEDNCKRAVEDTIKHYGHLDILINNAGVALNKSFVEHSEDDYNTIMDTNVKGVFLMTKAASAHHPKIIISISSGAGKSGFPGLSIYCASKFAVRGFMQSISQETHAKCYTVLPGGVDTRLYQEMFDARARVKPEQVANAIVSLCQEEPATGFELELYNIL